MSPDGIEDTCQTLSILLNLVMSIPILYALWLLDRKAFTLGWIQFSRILDKIFLLISGSIIGLGLFTATFGLLGFGSGNSMPVPKSLGSCSENVLFIIIEIC